MIAPRSPARDNRGIAPWYDEPIAALEAAFRDREFARYSRWLTEETVLDMSRSLGDNRGVHKGIANIEVVFRRFLEPWDEVDWHVTDVEELDGNRLLATTRVTNRGRASEAEVVGRGASLWEFDDDRHLLRWTLFQSRDDAVRELGLPK